jgi:26S proteasome regulatory subunit N1
MNSGLHLRIRCTIKLATVAEMVPKLLALLQSLFADILSVLAMTYSDTEPRGTLRYRLFAASMRPPTSPLADPGDWGHEYVRHLAAELGEECSLRDQTEVPKAVTDAGPAGPESATEDKEGEEVKPQIPLSVGTLEDLHNLALVCAKFLLEHNAEPDAVDLLEELEIVDQIVDLVDANTYSRVAAYMIA